MILLKSLEKIVSSLRSFDGIARKFVIPNIIHRLRDSSYNGNLPHSLGEDSAAIGTDCDDFVLLTTDAIVEELCLNHPHAAGFNAVLANIMDIYAAGGTPTSFAVALSYSDPQIGDNLLQGLIDGSHTFRVPIVRGHTNPSSSSTYVVGSATGTVNKHDILTAGGAEEDDQLIILFDKTGQRGEHYTLGWDAVTNRQSEEVIKRLSLMNSLAKEHLVHAAKDISVAGMVGTTGMMLEYSGKGGILDLDEIDAHRPDSISFEDWLRMYISLGFLVAVPQENKSRLFDLSAQHALYAVEIGVVNSSENLALKSGSNTEIMFDFSSGPLLTPKRM
ncbi:MAG: hypothetical protein GF411_02250 [Candidatus Lokiarchaeota archaeon]|nr:hypothetical protein [Candidatus Lokiarchaeota archaeon]